MVLRVLVFLSFIWGMAAAPVFASDAESEALALINAHRKAAGCAALTLQPQLQAAAEVQAKNMALYDYFGHQNPDGSKFSKRFRAAGYPGGKISENIAAGYAGAPKVVDIWMESSGHRKNILNCAYTETGIAVYFQENDQPLAGQSYSLRYYWVQTFGRS